MKALIRLATLRPIGVTMVYLVVALFGLVSVRELAVDLPHPRTVAALTTERYLDIKREAMAALAHCGAMATD